MRPTYLWKNGEVVTYHRKFSADDAENMPEICNAPCVDTNFDPDDTGMRYGMFRKDIGWKSWEFEDFPPEFKAHLLLLGVS